jgi:hypothetical protein
MAGDGHLGGIADHISERLARAIEYRDKAAQAVDPYERAFFSGLAANYEAQAQQLELAMARIRSIDVTAAATRGVRDNCSFGQT